MNAQRTSRQSGFTVIELIVVAVVLALAGLLAFVQVHNLTVANQDAQRKSAINAMYYALEEVYYKQHKTYPETLTAGTLPSVDPALFTDPDGFTLGQEALTQDELQKMVSDGNSSPDLEQRLASLAAGKNPNYHYDATDCDTDGNCKGYTLRADLVGEAQYVKQGRHN